MMDDLDIEIVDDVTSSNEVKDNNQNDNNTLPNLYSEIPTSNVSEVVSNNDNNVLNSNNNALENNTLQTDQVVNNNVLENTNVVNDTNIVNNNIEVNEQNNTLEQQKDVNNETIASSQPNIVNTNPNEVNIKNTTTIKNEVGTQVIGQVNGEEIKTVSNDMPENINITMKEEPVKKDTNKAKRIRIKTKRDKIRTIVITIVLVLVILGLGASGYYFFYLSNDNLFEVKNVTFELGEVLPISAVNYVETSKKIDDMEYNVNLSNVISSVGVYNYSVDHKGIVKMGTITIKDTKGPVITLNENLKFSVNSDVRKEDIVKSCEDPSMCTYELLDKVDTSTIGSQEITISAKDNIGNITKEIAKIEIFEVSKTLVCTTEAKKSEDETYEETLEDTIYFDTNDNYVYSTGRKVVSFLDFSSYFNVYNKEKDNTTYTFDSKNHSYKIVSDVLYQNEDKYDKYIEYYKDKGYHCK